ncbi:MAG TPA: hypothetical protein VFV31_15430 [Chitinophagaceae bacterium]|nr:hypothetical protein [Chitinophagaceae bacterium]
MEVHHHSHTSRKKWTHYFWEFLMLFLAVFCGFLAEYQLEHKIERDRGKQYIRSFYEDIVTDSFHFNELISRYEKKLTVLQSITPCYDSLLDGQSQKCFESIFRNSIDFPDMVYTDRTIQQLKNAGGLRLLKAADADSILLYDNLLRKYKIAETSGFQEIQSLMRATFLSVVKYESWNEWNLSPHPGIFTPYDNNRELLNRYFNQLKMYSLWCSARFRELQIIKKRNAALIDYFKKKNHFD